MLPANFNRQHAAPKWLDTVSVVGGSELAVVRQSPRLSGKQMPGGKLVFFPAKTRQHQHDCFAAATLACFLVLLFVAALDLQTEAIELAWAVHWSLQELVSGFGAPVRFFVCPSSYR